MSERKVLNKYYPPDFDPSKIPRMKQAKDGKFGIRLMAPFNMRCNTCGEYIYKGKKFNSRKETVSDEKYLGLYIFRFYIKCPRCIAEIAFKTDPENTDYTLEAGATRNFEALKTAERLAMKEAVEKEEEEKNNPMKVLENRTKASLQEMDMFETLEELREIRSKHNTVDMATILRMNEMAAAERAKREEMEDEEYVKSIFGKDGVRYNKRLPDDDDDDDEEVEDNPSCSGTKRFKVPDKMPPSSILTADLSSSKTQPAVSRQKAALAGVVVRKKTVDKEVLVTPAVVVKEESVTPATIVKEEPFIPVTVVKEESISITTIVKQEPVTTGVVVNEVSASIATVVAQSKPVGLAGLAAYSSSEEDNDSDN